MQKLKSCGKRADVRIPEGTKIYAYLFENNNHNGYAKWKMLEELVEQIPKSKEDRAQTIFNNFVEQFGELYPDLKRQIEFLRPLIFKQILTKQQLDTWYYEELKKK